MQSQVYLPTHIYLATIDRLEQIVAAHNPEDAHDVGMLRTWFIEALGEVGGIWPVCAHDGEDDPNGPSVFAVAA